MQLRKHQQESTISVSAGLESASHAVEQFEHLNPIIIGSVILVVVVIIVVIICCAYRRYMTRKLYDENPQHFSSRPELDWIENRRYEKSEIDSLTDGYGQTITRKQDFEGRYFEIKFKTHRNCIMFHHTLVADCYFEVEYLKLSSIVQMGFVHKDDVEKMCVKTDKGHQINMDLNGVSLRTDGSTIAYGVNLHTFKWSVNYGDVLGIGMTQHEHGRRIWVTKNGEVMNPPTEEEMMKEIKIEDGDDIQPVTKKKVDEQDPEEKEKKIKEIQKKKIEIKTSKKFKYYAVLISESGNEGKDETIVNWNVGAHNFRFFDGNKIKGLLNK